MCVYVTECVLCCACVLCVCVVLCVCTCVVCGIACCVVVLDGCVCVLCALVRVCASAAVCVWVFVLHHSYPEVWVIDLRQFLIIDRCRTLIYRTHYCCLLIGVSC